MRVNDVYLRDDYERSEGESALAKLRDCVSFIPEREREEEEEEEGEREEKKGR